MTIIIGENGMVSINDDVSTNTPTIVQREPNSLFEKSFIDNLRNGMSIVQACAESQLSVADLQSILADEEKSKEFRSILNQKYQSIDMIALDNLSHDVMLGDPRAITLWLKTRVPQTTNVNVRLIRE